MNDLQTLDIAACVSNTVVQVFDTMLSMAVEIFPGNPPPLPDGFRFVGSVAFAGDVTGSVSLQMSDAFARLLTANMLGMETEEIEGTEEIEDVIGELSNMIGGDVKSRFCDRGLPCELSVPSITSGSNFRIEQVGTMHRELIGIGYQEYIAHVLVCLK
jgi:CheY-specific phosphatase CheX